MKRLLILFLVVLSHYIAHAQLEIEPRSFNYGAVPLANQLYATFIVKNSGSQKGYLLKVEADKTITYKKPANVIGHGNSDTLRVWFSPETEGVFNKELKIYFSDNPKPVTVSLKGNLLKLDKDPTLNCYSFSQQQSGVNIILCDVKILVEDSTNNKPIENAAVNQYFNSKPGFTMHTKHDGTVSLSLKPDMYHYMIAAEGYVSITANKYINRQTGLMVFKLQPLTKEKPVVSNTVSEEKPKPPVKTEEVVKGLSTKEYASNNIVFLIDVSASMRTKDKLPLLKQSMHTLIDEMRVIDKVSIITYSDEARVICPSKPVTDKESLKALVDSLIANGATSANKGIELAHRVVMDNYIESGNNQIVLATDGAFSLREKDLALFDKDDSQNNTRVLVTVIGFGKDKKSLVSLKKVSSRFKGHYIYIPDEEAAKDALLNEIKQNSKKK